MIKHSDLSNIEINNESIKRDVVNLKNPRISFGLAQKKINLKLLV